MLSHRASLSDPAEILEGHLYLSSCRVTRSKEELEAIGVKYIINCAVELPNHFPHDFTYINLKMEDESKQVLVSNLTMALETIATAKSEKVRVLVHCQGGISRSSSCVIAYLMKEEKMTLRDAFLYVKSKKYNINPNEGNSCVGFLSIERVNEKGFMKQLCEYERELYGENTFNFRDYLLVNLVEMGFNEKDVLECLVKADDDIDLALVSLWKARDMKKE